MKTIKMTIRVIAIMVTTMTTLIADNQYLDITMDMLMLIWD